MCEGLPEPFDSLNAENVRDAENVPDAEIRRSKSLKPKFGQPEAENVPDAEIRRSKSLKLKFGLPPAWSRKCA